MCPVQSDEQTEIAAVTVDTAAGSGPRWAVRLFVLVFLMVIIVDTAPPQFALLAPMKKPLRAVLNRLGLWQGEWPLFAPDPQLNNGWLTAEIRSPDGNIEYENSRDWAEATAWEKFRLFRHVNYASRLPYNGKLAINDYCDNIARRIIGPGVTVVGDAGQGLAPAGGETDPALVMPRWRIVLHYNSLNLVPEADGRLTSADDTTWVAASRLLADREYHSP